MSEPARTREGQGGDHLARIADADPRGMIVLRGAHGDPALIEAATGVTGVAFPASGEARLRGDHGLLWMSPDEVMILLPLTEAATALETLQKALAGTHHLVADVSDARAIFRVTGPGARDVLAKLSPADLSPAALGPGRVRRTRLAQVAAAFWMTEDETGFEVVCFRSVADYVRQLLTVSARGDATVGYYLP